MEIPLKRWWTLLATAVAVVALVLGASLAQGLVGPDAGQTSSVAATSSEATYDLDLGQVSSPDQVRDCLTPGFASSPSQVQVLYGVAQRTSSGSRPVFVLRNRSGETRLCDEFGGDRPSQAPLPTVSETEPVTFLSTGRSSWQCGDTGALRSLRTTQWLMVSPEVATVAQRFWVDGAPGPWFTTGAQSGFAHLQAWSGPQAAGTTYAVQYRVLDAEDRAVPQDVLPTGRQPLTGCARSADIG